MKLILFFIICILNITNIISRTFYQKGLLTKDNSITVNGGDYCTYLDTAEFGNSGEIHIKVTAYYSFFMENIMYYGGSDNIEGSINLYDNKTFSSYTSSEPYYVYNGNLYYLEYTYYFYIPLPSTKKYLYISIPQNSMYATNAHSETRIILGLSTGAIVGIIFAVIAVIAIGVIVFICYRKKMRGSASSQATFNSPIVMQTNYYNPPPIVQPSYN